MEGWSGKLSGEWRVRRMYKEGWEHRAVEYKAKSGKIRYKPLVTEEEMQEMADGLEGWCLACGNTPGYQINPDDRNVTCKSCGEDAVHGIEELLVMGLYALTNNKWGWPDSENEPKDIRNP
jgi:hypothetical protein